jgi:CheY-like chemotaxis protein/anti-sigma regulatory factor (Ser/Thr protein kinase)
MAEDSRTTRSLIRSGLERAGYEVEEARDGLEAWELFTQAPHNRRFDLLLTDVVMPRMDGLELAQLVRKADPALPIGVITSNEDKETVKAALNLGVNEFLNKPFERADLLECVNKLLAVRSTRLDARRSLATAQAVRLAQRSMAATPERGLPLYTLYEPLSDAGGDVFRCFRCADGSILFVLADVAGHSVLSSYAVASFLGMLSTYVGECYGLMVVSPSHDSGESELPCSLHGCGRFGHIPCDPLPHLAAKLNYGIHGGPFSEVPVCTLLGLWTPATGRLRLLNAGIPHGLHRRRRQGDTVPVALNGTPLGVFAEADLEGAELQLEPGDRFLFGTDGFFEVQSAGLPPFQDLAPGQWQALAESPLDWALNEICGAARSHGGGVIADDLLVVGFEQPGVERSAQELVLRLPSTPRAIDLACDRFEQCLKATCDGRLRKDRRFDILLAVREALSNAVFHGNGNRPGTTVSLRCLPDPERRSLVVAVADEGPGFDLAAATAPEDPLSERGRGLPLIRHHARDVAMNGGTMTMTFLMEESDHDDQ